MGKRKRRPGHRKSLVSSDIMPCSLGMDSLSEEKSSSTAPSVDSGSSNSLKSIMDTIDSSMKKINTHPSLAQYRYNLSRSMLLRRSLNNYGHHYSRRSTGSHADRISSLCKSASAIDERYSMKLGSRCNSESGYHSGNSVVGTCSS
ncbi:PREDICTED: uncharacterized protein LOC104592539 isoform X2 [Nelumbo nucifera]|uniref:Uncharacterized protein n=2 Tax=Nelumbo nucifera TaxID=4432 RepID=A0A822ZNC6_NELNU|nr:PREDICTED: uncharacterized protein LOC104592539 isoform X2 [Nelumbo nucifera]DAD45041.1 TPA_asm: hypothetical protein HUJ06_003271 [Nelumbo nucifera]